MVGEELLARGWAWRNDKPIKDPSSDRLASICLPIAGERTAQVAVRGVVGAAMTLLEGTNDNCNDFFGERRTGKGWTLERTGPGDVERVQCVWS